MAADALAEFGHLFLGSRIKRLADRFQAEATEALLAMNYPVQPAHMLVLATLRRKGPLTVGALARHLRISQPSVSRAVPALLGLGFVTSDRVDKDQRQKTLALSAQGEALVARAEREFWPLVEAAAVDLCAGLDGPFLEQITMLEANMDRSSLVERVTAAGAPPSSGLAIRDYDDRLADDFYRINAEWIGEMFKLEENDRTLLSEPRRLIVDKGGAILFAETRDLGIVGTCALMNMGNGWFELTKMAVLKTARGRKVGEFLLQETLARAKAMGIEKLYLLTNTKCAAAVHLYEKLGFEHDGEVMEQFGKRYERCNVAMRFACR